MASVGERVSRGERALIYATLSLVAIAMLLPFLWLLRSSLCDERSVIQTVDRVSNLIPSSLHPENYLEAFRAVPLLRYLRNTVFITLGVLLGTVASSSLCAYAFSFCPVRYGRFLFYGVLATMMLPGVVTLIPVFILFRELGWIDTLKPLIVPAFFGNAFAIFLFRQFFMGLPKELIEASRMDGATNLDIHWRVVMPLSRPVIVTIALFSFMGSWNDFMGPLIFLNSQENWTLQVGLQSFQGEVASQWNLLMAATVMVLAPVLLAFFALQRQFIRGIALTGLKG